MLLLFFSGLRIFLSFPGPRMFQAAKESLEVTHRCHDVKNVHQILCFFPPLGTENRNYYACGVRFKLL